MARIFLDTQLSEQVDGSYLSKGLYDFEAGLTPEQLFEIAFKGNPSWAVPSVSGGLSGSGNKTSGVSNPFSKETWNVTEQHKMMSDNPTLAESMRASAKK